MHAVAIMLYELLTGALPFEQVPFRYAGCAQSAAEAEEQVEEEEGVAQGRVAQGCQADHGAGRERTRGAEVQLLHQALGLQKLVE